MVQYGYEDTKMWMDTYAPATTPDRIEGSFASVSQVTDLPELAFTAEDLLQKKSKVYPYFVRHLVDNFRTPA